MKSINEYINEAKHSFKFFSEAKHSFGIFNESKHSFRIKSHLSKYKHKPANKDELVECIKTELDAGNTDLNCIDTSRITDMALLFDEIGFIKLTKEQQETLDISEWNTSNVTNMRYMFSGCMYFNGDISKWNTSNVTNMSHMFFKCKKFKINIDDWDVSNVTDMKLMIYSSGLERNKPTWYK